MQLPVPVQAYFTADHGTDADALIAGFAPDAVVQDEGAQHVGHAEILAWRMATKAKYPDVVSEPVGQITDGDRHIVQCRVSGDFPGSPITLDFAFTLVGSQISALDIH